MTLVDRITATGAQPEQLLAAAVIRLALFDAQRGDDEARTWIARQSPAWLAFVTPAGVSVDAVHRRLLAAGGIGVVA